MAITEQKLFEIICEQIEAINALTEQLKNGGAGPGGSGSRVPTIGANSKWRIQPLIQKIEFDANKEAVLEQNRFRQGFIIVNKTDDIVYGVGDDRSASVNYFTWQIESEASEYYIPSNGAYTGDVFFNAVGIGYLMVTEFSFQEGF